MFLFSMSEITRQISIGIKSYELKTVYKLKKSGKNWRKNGR